MSFLINIFSYRLGSRGSGCSGVYGRGTADTSAEALINMFIRCIDEYKHLYIHGNICKESFSQQ